MKRLLPVVLLSMAWFLIASGQDDMQMGMPMRGPGAQRLEQFKKIRMMEVLNLDEQTSLRFFARYNKHKEELEEQAKKRNDLLDELARLRGSNASEKEYQKTLDDVRALARPAIEVRERYFDDLAKILSPKQLADYLVFERNFLTNVRDIMREMQRERRGMPRR